MTLFLRLRGECYRIILLIIQKKRKWTGVIIWPKDGINEWSPVSEWDIKLPGWK